MDKKEHERRQEELRRFAESEGADYYDPENPAIWKRYIVGPVPRWRRLLWWFFPPSHQKMGQIQQHRNDKLWKEAWPFQ